MDFENTWVCIDLDAISDNFDAVQAKAGVPVMAIIIYVILLAQSDWVAVIVCFFMCFPIVYTNILEGLDAMPLEYLEVGSVYGLSGLETAKYI